MAKRRRRMFFVIACAGLFSRELPAAPVDESAARRVAQTLLGLTHPAATFAKSPSAAKGKVALAIVRVTPVRHAGETVGYVAALAPAGFILLRADDQAPPVKLSSDAGRIDQLPPSFLELVERELAAELGVIRMSKFGQSSRLSNYQTQWAALLKGERPGASTGAALLAGSSPGAVLLQTSWDQSSPYNYYCPVYGYFLGEALRTPVGCVPTALGQILRYHQQPAAVTQDASYSDSQGSLRGVHATSDAEMTPYRWSSMPFALEESSPAVEIEAVGQLLYHVAVAVEADFEQSQTSAYSYSVQRPLFKQFQYVSTGFQERSGLTTAQWYNKVATEIDAARPIFYRLASADESSSHALVCDGYRNGNEIHLNMGWAGTGNAWYNLDTVINVFVYPPQDWVVHAGLFGLTPPGATTLAAPLLNAEPATTKGPKNTVAWVSMTGGPPSAPAGPSAGNLPGSAPVNPAASSRQGGVGEASLPNLTPFRREGYSDVLVVSTKSGTWTDDLLSDDELLYLDWGVINNGGATVEGDFTMVIEVDNVSWVVYHGGYSAPNQAGGMDDIQLGMLPAGTHTITLRLDTENAVIEADETDNTFTKTITVRPAGGVEYLAEMADNPQFVAPRSSGWVSALAYTFGDLVPTQTYWYRLKARRGQVESSWSNIEHSEQLLTGTISLSGDLAFGDVRKGGAAWRDLHVANIGTEPFAVTQLTLPAGFTAPECAWGCDFELAPGEARDIEIDFAPTAVGAYGGMIVVGTDACAGMTSIAASGVGRRAYDLWVESRFAPSDYADPAKEATVWGPNADPDYDGRVNLLEYALGSNPNGIDEAGLDIQWLDTNPEKLRMKFRHRLFDDDLECTPEVSGDCCTWHGNNPYTSFLGRQFFVEDGTVFVWDTLEDVTAAAPGAPRFMRLRIRQH